MCTHSEGYYLLVSVAFQLSNKHCKDNTFCNKKVQLSTGLGKSFEYFGYSIP